VYISRRRKVNIEVGDMLQGELASVKVQDEAKVSGNFVVESDDRGKNSAAVPVHVEFRFNGPMLDWRGAM